MLELINFEMILIFQIKYLKICLLIHLQSQNWIIHRVHDKLNVIILIIFISSFDLLFFLLRISHLVAAFSLRFEISNKDNQLHKNENILFFHLLDLLDSRFFVFASNNFFCMHLISLHSSNSYHVIILFSSFCLRFFLLFLCNRSFSVLFRQFSDICSIQSFTRRDFLQQIIKTSLLINV